VPFTLWLASIAIVLWPRVSQPQEMPGLYLDAQQIHRELARLPEGAIAKVTRDKLDALYREQGQAEIEASEGKIAGVYRERQRFLALSEIAPGPRKAALRHARALALKHWDETVGSELPENDPYLGAFAAILERYHVAEEKTLLGPPFVARTLFKARWNTTFNQPATWDFYPIEREAYWGWLVLSADQVPADRRAATLAQEPLSSLDREETQAVLLSLEGAFAKATEVLQAHANGFRNLRKRNYYLGSLASVDHE